MPYSKPRHSSSRRSNSSVSNLVTSDRSVASLPVLDSTVSAITASNLLPVFPSSDSIAQALRESIEICCPVCGFSSFIQDKTGQISCEECDYVEVVDD